MTYENRTPIPTREEETNFSIRAFKGIEVGLDQDDPLVGIAQKLEERYPNHLILVQQAKFLHGFDKTAYALSVLKKYKLKLVGTADEPHIRVGFPAGNFKRQLSGGALLKVRTAPLSESVPYLWYVVWKNHISSSRHIRSRYHRRLRQ